MHLEAALKRSNVTKHWFNVILSLIGIGIPLFYSLCGGSCAYLTGSIFSVDLKYIGVLYMGLLLLFSLLRKGFIILLLLSLGMGAEIHLVAFQIKHLTACYFCFAFGAVIVILFLLNFDTAKKALIIFSVMAGFILFSLFFHGSVTPLYAEDPPKADLLPSFGNGKTQVRLYTDYFCGPCSSLEPKLEKMLTDLVKKNMVSITLIDTPIHKHSSLYATYFLYILNEKKDFTHALHSRAILFEAAKKKVKEKEQLEEYLKKRNIGFKPFDTSTTFKIFNAYFQEDKITATPTCVISNGEKKSFTGEKDITKVLEGLYNKN
jgi:thiol:disulfide interchange protein DsbA